MKMFQSNQIICQANREVVYSIISDSQRWPDIFEPCLSVKLLNRSEYSENIQITAWVNDEEMTWESQRIFLKDIAGIYSKILKPMKLVKSMNVFWIVIPMNHFQSVVILEHTYEICEDVSGIVPGIETQLEALKYMEKAIHTNSSKELMNIKNAAERTIPIKQVNLKWSTSNEIICNSSAEKAYFVLKDIKNWPFIFDICISAEVIEQKDSSEVVRVQAFNNDNNIISWNTERIYYDSIHRIDFNLPIPMPLLKSLHGHWRVVELDKDKCLINVVRYFELLNDVKDIYEGISTPDQALDYIKKFIDDNAETEMLALKSFLEKNKPTFVRSKKKYFLPFLPEKVYAVFSEITHWPQILPHCRSVNVLYDDSENQEFIMTITSPAGDVQLRSIRKCQKNLLSISYFQPLPLSILETYSGQWIFKPMKEGTEIISLHMLHVNPDTCENFFKDTNLSVNKKRVKELVVSHSDVAVESFGNWLSRNNI